MSGAFLIFSRISVGARVDAGMRCGPLWSPAVARWKADPAAPRPFLDTTPKGVQGSPICSAMKCVGERGPILLLHQDAGDHKGPLHLHSTALAPTDQANSQRCSRLRHRRWRATGTASPRNSPADQQACPGLRHGPPSTLLCDRHVGGRHAGV